MAKFSRQSVEAFQNELEKIDESWQAEFNFRETIAQSFDQISRARKLKVSWEQIAEMLMKASESNANISSESIRQYYFELSKHPELLDKGKRKSKSCKAKARSQTSKNSLPKIAISAQEETEDSVSEDPSLQKQDVVSQFNLDRLK